MDKKKEPINCRVVFRKDEVETLCDLVHASMYNVLQWNKSCPVDGTDPKKELYDFYVCLESKLALLLQLAKENESHEVEV